MGFFQGRLATIIERIWTAVSPSAFVHEPGGGGGGAGD